MENTNKAEKKVKGFVVIGVRHFENGEHHWIAPCDIEEAKAFGECGKVVELEAYEKPVFESMTDSEHFAMSLAHGKRTLEQWEAKRPTWYVVEVDTYLAIVERGEYSLPLEAEEWSDAKVADFERECDCEDIVNLALWDSETEEERMPQKILDIARHIDNIEGLSAWIDGDRIAVSPTGRMNKEAVADYIESVEGFPNDEVRWVVSDESVNTAWYEVK